MIGAARGGQADASDFLLTAGLLQAYVLDRVPFERLARDYGFAPERLRTKLFDHLEECLAALVIEMPTALKPEAVPAAPPARIESPPAPAIRVRERVPRSA